MIREKAPGPSLWGLQIGARRLLFNHEYLFFWGSNEERMFTHRMYSSIFPSYEATKGVKNSYEVLYHSFLSDYIWEKTQAEISIARSVQYNISAFLNSLCFGTSRSTNLLTNIGDCITMSKIEDYQMNAHYFPTWSNSTFGYLRFYWFVRFFV